MLAAGFGHCEGIEATSSGVHVVAGEVSHVMGKRPLIRQGGLSHDGVPPGGHDGLAPGGQMLSAETDKGGWQSHWVPDWPRAAGSSCTWKLLC